MNELRFFLAGLVGFSSYFVGNGLKVFLPHDYSIFFPLYNWLLFVTIPMSVVGFVLIIVQVKRCFLFPLKTWQLYCVGVCAGFFLSCLVTQGALKWEDARRNKAGQMLSVSLENYRRQFGYYPAVLGKLGYNLKETLPYPFSYQRFNYTTDGDAYYLSSQWLFDYWEWNEATEQFDYIDRW